MSLLKTTLLQIGMLIKKKTAIITFVFLLVLVLANYIANIFEFMGRDVVNMYHPMKMLSLSYNKTYYNSSIALILTTVFPLLVNIPAGLSLNVETQNKTRQLVSSRIGNSKYICSRLISSIVTTFIVFSVPFLIEIVLNCIAFPLNAKGDFWNLSMYDPQMINNISAYQLSGLYIYSPYLYAIILTLFFGAFCGLLAGFTIIISAIFPIKFKVILLLPIFLLLELSVYSSGSLHTAWFNYILFFNDTARNGAVFYISISVIVLLTVLGAVFASKKDVI